MSAEVRAGPPETFVNVESWSAMVNGLRCFFRGSMYLDALSTRHKGMYVFQAGLLALHRSIRFCVIALCDTIHNAS